MIGRKEVAYLECDVCGRAFLCKDPDAKLVLARARESGWACPPVNVQDRSGDMCPRCRPPDLDAHVLPSSPARGALAAELPRGGLVDMRRVISVVLVEEVSPGLTAAEEIARVVVQGALAGDKGMIRILTDGGGQTDAPQCAVAEEA